MKSAFLIVCMLCMSSARIFSQGYTPKIETGACQIKIANGLIARCGYLVVPENRQKPQGRTIKIPFVYVRQPGMDSIRNVILNTTGGPGYSTIANFDSLRYNSDFFQFGGFIAFDQRGTKRSHPCLDCPEVGESAKHAYRENLSKDSLELIAVKQCRQRLAAQGIDLSAYNTIESAADINDLRRALQLDSLTLLGISYSGGLMLTVARNHPEAVKALILNSPLPGYVNYEEHALFNFNEALNQVFDNCEADSTHDARYAGLRERFHQYFTSLAGKKFSLRYAEPGKRDSFTIRYTKDELTDAVIDRLNTGQLKTVPFVMTNIINGNHAQYVREQVDGVFRGNQALSAGMRYSIYCSEQIAYADKALIKQQDEVLPWLAGHPFNNVDHAICTCWQVKPEPAIVKTPVYSNVPALIAGGDADPWCRPFYNRLIKRTMPHAQLITVHNNGHGARLGMKGVDFAKMFLTNPYKKLVSPLKEVTVE
ncbi:alpha/beta fold hydrolase [Paraflavitalea soli]|uniref:Proline iminopeptidase n=1 Tax=Paraflavitalea soli TaxID=2315862 RepID=A0A3B7ME47_9BACT|nr:alpha/beta fold hydrolase [Paraflavitalea soli]AXY72594.1 alpha/beta fold hydrolase [Paraflavitalea soli]